jgi:hypothetical protein
MTTASKSGKRKQNVLQFPRQEPHKVDFHSVLLKSPRDEFAGQLVASTERLSRALQALCDICASLVQDAPSGDARNALKWLDAALDDCCRIKKMLDEYQSF